jgi:hypothetical protein
MIKEVNGKQYELPDGLSEQEINKALASLKSENIKTVETIENDSSILDDSLNVLAELSAGANRSILETIDFLGPDTVNAILGLTGSEYKLPRLMELAEDYGIQGGFMDEGLARNAVRAAGETAPIAMGMQTAIRNTPDLATEFVEASKTFPNLTTKTIDVIKRLPKNIQASVGSLFNTAKNEGPLAAAALGSISGGAGEVGREYGGSAGEFIGSIAAPTLGSGIGSLAKKSFNNYFDTSLPGNPINEYANDLFTHQVTDRITRSGIPTEQIPQKIDEISPSAVLADLDENTQRTLREKMNESPVFHAEANRFLNQRQAGRINRVKEATLSEGYNADIENAIETLKRQTQPAISRLYELADAQPMELTPWLKRAIKGERENITEDPLLLTPYKDEIGNLETDPIFKNSIYKLQPKVEERLANYELLGKPITDFSIINETKKVLDDEIAVRLNSSKQSAANEIAQLVGLKNRLLQEADEMNPYYPQARELFAGRAALQNAAKIGSNIFKTEKSDLLNQIQKMSKSELDFYHMGARQAILDKIDNSVDTGNLSRKLFNRVGDKEKIATLFNSNEELERYLKVMEAEYALTKTKNAAQGNSSTTPQLKDLETSGKDLINIIETATDMATGNTPSLFSKLRNIGRLFKKNMPTLKEMEASTEYQNAKYEVGKVMLMRGDDLKKVLDVVENANAKKLYTIIGTLERDRNKIYERIDKVYRRSVAPAMYSGAADRINERN